MDLHNAGGIPQVMKILLNAGLIHGDCKNIEGKTISEYLQIVAESLDMNLSRKLRNYDLLVELDLSGASFSKQFKKANKLKSKSIIIIGDDEAIKGEFIIRLFDQSGNGNEE